METFEQLWFERSSFDYATVRNGDGLDLLPNPSYKLNAWQLGSIPLSLFLTDWLTLKRTLKVTMQSLLPNVEPNPSGAYSAVEVLVSAFGQAENLQALLCPFMILCVAALLTDVAVLFHFNQRHDDERSEELIYTLSSPAGCDSKPITTDDLSGNEGFQSELQHDFGMRSMKDYPLQMQFNQCDIVILMLATDLIGIVDSVDSQHELNAALNHAVNSLKLENANKTALE